MRTLSPLGPLSPPYSLSKLGVYSLPSKKYDTNVPVLCRCRLFSLLTSGISFSVTQAQAFLFRCPAAKQGLSIGNPLTHSGSNFAEARHPSIFSIRSEQLVSSSWFAFDSSSGCRLSSSFRIPNPTPPSRRRSGSQRLRMKSSLSGSFARV